MPTVAASASDLDALLADLNPAQREAATAVEGPVAILAGAGTGKTRVISRRAAYAIRSGYVAAEQVLVVTFTDKAAGEMVERLRALGLGGVVARTFHAHALTQLRHFWPSRHDGAALPGVLDSKAPLLVPLARALPGHYRFTPVKDLADEIEWAKSRRVPPGAYERALGMRQPPIPPDLMARVYAGYERAKTRIGRLDFDDMLTLTVDLLESDEEAASLVRARKRWFSVDEYQDTTPLQERLLELWAGGSRDIAVVGDEDQTIYTFAGATPALLTGFAARHPGARVVELTENYRSTPQVLELANRLLASQGRSKRLAAAASDGPTPSIERYPDAAAELDGVVDRLRRWHAEGIRAAETAVLVRTNAQLAPLEDALTRAGMAFQVRGVRFFDRPEVRGAIDVLRRSRLAAGPLAAGVRATWRRELGYGADDGGGGAEAREREASLDTLLAILAETSPPSLEAFIEELERRRAAERAAAGSGVNLLTLHRAKGLEWDGVVLPALEEGLLPIRPSDPDESIDEERRLFYVGITRARTHLALSWALRREVRGRDAARTRSRFLEAIQPRPAARVTQLPDAFERHVAAAERPPDPLFELLRAWRAERARVDGVPAYVVAHDSVLRDVAELRPATLAQLRRIRGFGPTKLERYGGEVLEVVASRSE
jgi:DNA helicase-2/ATP-dependent DNA helicase PcrA